MTKPDCCAIAVVLDRSGSMGDIRQATIDGFNEFLQGQKAVPGEATLTLVQFDNEYEVHHAATPLATAPPLNDATYVPRGTTALLDAIGRTIDELGARLAAMAEHDRPSRVLVTIITDGLENASVTFAPKRINEMITHQRQKYGWEFMFLGANQDAITSGRELGIDTMYSASFRSSDRSSKKAFKMASDKLAFARLYSMPSTPYSDAERAYLMNDDDGGNEGDSAPPSPPPSIIPPTQRTRRSGGGPSPSRSTPTPHAS